MPREIVVFDTNVFRSIGHKHVDAMHSAHRAHRVVSVVSKHVAIELVSASYGDSPGDAGAAWSGLRALVQMTRLWDGRSYVPFTQSRLEQHVLSRGVLEHDRRQVGVLGRALMSLYECGHAPTTGVLAEDCRTLRQEVLQREEAYGAAMFEAGQKAGELAMTHLGAEPVNENETDGLRV